MERRKKPVRYGREVSEFILSAAERVLETEVIKSSAENEELFLLAIICVKGRDEKALSPPWAGKFSEFILSASRKACTGVKSSSGEMEGLFLWAIVL